MLTGKEFKIRSREDLVRLVDNYDALIRESDELLRRLYGSIAAIQPEKPSLWLVTSDHGEGVLSHMKFGHGNSV